MSSVTIITLLIQTLFLYSNAASPSSSVISPFLAGSRSLLRSIESDESEKHDYVVDLNATNFDSVLNETPATYAIVEFFAHWCPACRNYKPQYEKVAKIFNGADAVHPGNILMTRVDCAKKINTNLCDKFSVGHYPTLLWGPPSKFVRGSFDPNQGKSEILSIDDGRTADRLLNWINKQMSSSYHFNDQKYENDQLVMSLAGEKGKKSAEMEELKGKEDGQLEKGKIVFLSKALVPNLNLGIIDV